MSEKKDTSEKKDLDSVILNLRKVSIVLADIAFKLHIKPNQITLFRFFVLGLGAAASLIIGGYLFNILAFVLLLCGFMLDLIDGDLARRHNLKSPLGKALEDTLDGILLNTLILAISINLYIHFSPFALAGLFCLFAQTFSKHYTDLYQQKFNINCVESNPALEEARYQPEFDRYSRFYAELLAPRNSIYSLFSNFRYYLVFGILTNTLGLMLVGYTVMINLRWIFLAIFTVHYSATKDHIGKRRILTVLSKLETR